MKKFLSVLMTLAMVLSLMAGFAVSASAEETVVYAEENYEFRTALEEGWGTHEVDDKGVVTAGQILFGDGLWTYEYFDQESATFHPMQCYYATAQDGGKCGWGNMYYSNDDAMWAALPETYVAIGSTGKQIHPGNGAGVVVTFIVPFTGVVSYNGSVKAYGTGNTSDAENGGDSLYLYVNDQQVWPASEDDAVFYYDTTQETPKTIQHDAFSVKKGDKIRMMVTVKPGTTNGGKGCHIVDYPVVTYTSAVDDAGNPISVGNPNGEPPTTIAATKTTSDGFTLSWDAAKKAVGYNVYINGEKKNSEPITQTTYVVTGLESKTNYNVQISTVTEKSESALSPETLVRTKAGTDDPKKPSTPSSEKPAASEAATNVTNNQSQGQENNMLWIIIAAVAAVVVIAAVVVVIIVIKKKKA